MPLRGKIAGTGMLAGHSYTAKNMLVNEITCVAQPGVATCRVFIIVSFGYVCFFFPNRMENDVNCSATCLSVVSMDCTAGFVLSHLVLLSGGFVVNMPPLFNIHCSITKLGYSFLFVPVGCRS